MRYGLFLATLSALACSEAGVTKYNSDPTASITSHIDGDAVDEGVAETVRGQVGDPNHATEDLSVTWLHNGEETCTESAPDAEGVVSCAMTFDADGAEVILEVRDPEGAGATARVTLEVTPEEPPNSPPTCAITGPEAGSVTALGETITFTGTADDLNVAADFLNVDWSSDKDGPIGSSTPTSAGEVTFPFSGLTANTHVIAMTVTDELGATCSTDTTVRVGVPPELAITAPTDGAVLDHSAPVVFEATVSDNEDLPTDIAMSWESDIDGVFSTDGADSAGSVTVSADSLTAGPQVVTLTATDTDGLFVTDTVTFTLNQPPTAPTVTIDPDPAATDQALLATASGSVDPEGTGTVTYAYEWFEDGISSGESVSATFPASATAKHHTYRVQVTASDGLVSSAFGYAEVTVVNSAPVLTGPSLSAAAASVGDALTCSATATDIDPEDSPTVTYVWSDGSTEPTYTVTDADAVGSTITCTATANDGDGGTASASASASVTNTPPVMGPVTISPDPAYNTDTLVCSATATDADGSAPSIAYAWSGGATGPELPLTSIIAASGDTLTCTATATDSDGGTSEGSASIELGNRAPTVTASLSPEAPTRHDALTCTAAAIDPDDDATALGFEWAIDGVATPASAGSATDSTLEGGFASGNTVTCTVTADDAKGGMGTDTVSVDIGNTAPEVTAVSITPAALYTNDTATAVATATDSDGDALTLTHAFSVDGTAVSDGSSTTLDGTTHFDKGQTVSVTVTATDGMESASLGSAIAVVLNTPPTAPVISISGGEDSTDGDDGSDCDDGWTLATAGDRCLRAFPEPANWNDASANCASYGGQLLTLNGYDEQLEIAELFRSAAVGDHDYFLIGFTDRDDEGTFTWTSGSDSTYTHWGPGEPNDMGGGQDCTMVTNHAEGYWDDISCSDVSEFGSMCEVTIDSESERVQWRAEDGGNDHWYAVRSSVAEITWSEARLAAEAEGGHLVSLTSAEENDWVYTTLLTDESLWMMGAGHARGPYIGLYESGGSFVWVTGEPTEYTNWVPGDPNGGGSDDVGSFYTPSPATSRTWSDENFTSVGHHYVVEWPSLPGSDLTCIIDEASTDADGDPITYTVDWDVDGTPFTDTDTAIIDGDTVPGDAVGTDEIWTCTVTPNDGDDDGDSATATHEVACAVGSDATCPALDCDDVLDERPDAESGIYWIQPIGDVYRVYCNMDIDGGGWTLVMKAVNSNFLYSDPVWETETLHDETDLSITVPGEAKYQSFNEVPFTEMMTSDPDDFHINHTEVIDGEPTSALEHFSGPGILLDEATYSDYFHDRTSEYFAAWGCSEYDRYGFNLYDSLGCVYIASGMGCDHNGGARWGNRVNGWYEGGGNLTGHGWANYSCSASTMPGIDTGTGSIYVSTIRELLWVR